MKTSGITEIIQLGKFSQEELDHLIHEASALTDITKRIDFLSRQFLDIEYREPTLIGDAEKPEVFVIDLGGVDCLTYIEYVEAMRLSDSFSAFKDMVKTVRYKSGIVAFENRNHFFTDWQQWNSDFVDDITEEIGAQETIRAQKMFNEKEDGTYFLPGIHPVQREITYIPSNVIDESVFNRLESGDYVGIYSELQGLDVSHVGIVIKDGNNIYLRHASSLKEYRKVIDQDFRKYIIGKPGIIVLRLKDPQKKS